jgi:cytochrome c6
MRYLSILLCLFWLITACGNDSHASSAAAQPSTAPSAPDGMAVFRKYCVACHGADGKLGLSGAKDLTQSILTIEERTILVKQGKNLMTPFGDILSPQEISAVVDYTMTLKK